MNNIDKIENIEEIKQELIDDMIASNGYIDQYTFNEEFDNRLFNAWNGKYKVFENVRRNKPERYSHELIDLSANRYGLRHMDGSDIKCCIELKHLYSDYDRYENILVDYRKVIAMKKYYPDCEGYFVYFFNDGYVWLLNAERVNRYWNGDFNVFVPKQTAAYDLFR